MSETVTISTRMLDAPRILAIAKRLHVQRSSVIGAAVLLIAFRDVHADNGRIAFVSASDVDEHVGIEGFAEAAEAVGLLVFDGEGVELLGEFSEARA